MNTGMEPTLAKKDEQYVWHAMQRPGAAPLIADSGEGSWFTDTNGNRYMDGVSGLWCLNLGHGQTEIIEAATEQMNKLAYFPLSLGHQPAITLAEKLAALFGGGFRTFLPTAALTRTKRPLKSRANTISKPAPQKNKNHFPLPRLPWKLPWRPCGYGPSKSQNKVRRCFAWLFAYSTALRLSIKLWLCCGRRPAGR